MKLNYELIAKRLIKRLKMSEDGALFDKDGYLNGVYDMLDSISEAHPELIYEIHLITSILEDEE